MGSQMNFRNFGEVPPGEDTVAKTQGNFSLARQSSVYSLTFDEFQNTWSGLGKDVGSMNMDELLKNIWTAEETQAMTSAVASTAVAPGGGGSVNGGNLQRQGSLTLPRTISQKTVDEVWKDLIKENSSVNDNSGVDGNLPQRQATLGEVTLEEFLIRAGVVREDAQPIEKPFNCGFFGDLSREDNNTGLALGMLLGNQIVENKNVVSNQNPNTVFVGAGGVRSSQPQQQQQPPLFPKPATVTFATSMNEANNAQFSTLGSRTTFVEPSKPPLHDALIHGVGLGSRVVTVASKSQTNTISSDISAKNNISAPTYSPVPFAFGRGRRSGGAVEKVVERRQRRMIKNRESAARSRARKQAYTLELEAEVAKLKETNQELHKKQREIMEMQNSQILEEMKWQLGGKRLCLRRTLTGPW